MTLTRALRAGYLLVMASVLVWLFATRWEVAVDLLRRARLGWLLAALAASFGMLALGAGIWFRVLDALGATAPYSLLAAATARSVPARYIPGSIWFAVGRIGLLRRAGLPTGPLTVAATAEVVLSVAVTLSSGALILGIRGRLPAGGLWAIAAAALIVVVATPPVGGRLVAAVAARRGATLPKLSWPAHGRILAAVAIFWLWSAFTFSLYLRGFPPADGFAVIDVVGGFLFAWGIGFLAFVAPQGVGVFEVGLAALLPGDDLAALALMIGGYRILILARDALATAAAEVIATRAGRAASDPPG